MSALATPTVRPATRPGARRVPVLDPAWPLGVITVGMPVAYLLGLSALVWIIPAFAFGIPLLVRRSLRMPAGALALLALAVWIPITGTRLSQTSSIPIFAYRWLLFVSAAVVMLWLCNTSTRRVPTERVVRMLAVLWIVLVAFGYAAILFPDLESTSFAQRLIPGGLLSNEFVYDLTVIRFAEVQQFVDGVVPRPAAPMPYSNGWGSTLGLLTPFFVLAWLTVPSRRRRVAGLVLVGAAIVPILVSTNRGLWLSVGVGLLYYAWRRALRGDARPLIGVVLVAVAAVTMVLVTPLGDTVNTRLQGASQSNTSRESVYERALAKTKDSPLLGYGTPETTDRPPPLGTHGLLWYVLFSHGFTGLALLVVAAVTLFVTTMRARTTTALWAHVVIVIFIVQIPFYGLLPQIVVIGIAAGVAWRENNPVQAARGPA